MDLVPFWVELFFIAVPISFLIAMTRYNLLDIDRILAIASRSGAEAIHPGYGLLSENGDFADRCAAAGIVFCGPNGDVMRAMGDKITSRRIMHEAGVPIVPGGLEALDDEAIAVEAERLGYPLMLKASAGGGGEVLG